MAIPLSNLYSKNFSDLYPKRPVWAIASNGAAALPSPVFSCYAEDNPFVPLNVESATSTKSRSRNYTDEMHNAAKTFAGPTTLTAATSTFSPTAGAFGITQFCQNACLVNFDAYDTGNYGYYDALATNSAELAAMDAIVVGEPNWRQCYELLASTNGRLYKIAVGGTYTAATNSNRPFVDLAAVPGFNNAGTFGYGQASHNRNTGRLLIAQPVAGANGVSMTFRLHFIDLQMKIGKDTHILEIDAAIKAACAAGASRYRNIDVVFNSASVYSNAGAMTHDVLYTRFVLCDNDEVWAFKSKENSSANVGGNVLFAVNLTGGDWETGTYTANPVVTFAAPNIAYGGTNGRLYSPKHMNSDDNSVVALYQHAYYYIAGFNLAMVSTKDAGATSYNYAANTGTLRYAIAPTGRANFALCNVDANNDGQGAVIGHIDNTVLAATSITPVFLGGLYPSNNSSTSYGGNLILKVQPTSEWK